MIDANDPLQVVESWTEGSQQEAVSVPIRSLLPGQGPRRHGVDETHVQLLAQSELQHPPILVQRSTMRVIDGMHRLQAALLRGADSIHALMLDDDDQMAFLRSVTSNIKHGLPLTLADRRAAAERLLEMFAHWSDRSLGRATGLSAKTISTLRQRSGQPMPAERTGRDGRVRPTDADAGRKAVVALLAERPDASLREIARLAGVSPNTVRTIRRKQNEGAAGSPSPARALSAVKEAPGAPEPSWDVTALALENLAKDPSVRYTEAGRTLLRMLHQQLSLVSDHDIINALPPHCLPLVARLSRGLSQQWEQLSARAAIRVQTEVG
ncbi:ParB/RepB/Spo0J family partition protein [Micromonospora chalcea]